jgi:hypothetical protein
MRKRSRGTGKGLRFIEAVLQQKSDECILWPFYKMKVGYGQLGNHVGMVLAHRYACERAHGPAPEGYQTAHSCGNRACVNPRHLRWATPKENEDDKHAHGTWLGRISGAKLTEDTVLLIRKDAAAGTSKEDLAAQYQTPLSTIRKVINRESWKHV